MGSLSSSEEHTSSGEVGGGGIGVPVWLMKTVLYLTCCEKVFHHQLGRLCNTHTHTHQNFRLPAADTDREVTNQVPGPKPASAICIFFLLQRVELRAGTSHLSPRDVCKSSCGTNKQKKNERRSSETPHVPAPRHRPCLHQQMSKAPV